MKCTLRAMMLIALLSSPPIESSGQGTVGLEATGNCTKNATTIIGGNSYCNITSWTPRISKADGVLAIVVPTLVAAIPMCIFVFRMVTKIKRMYIMHKNDEQFKYLMGIPLPRFIQTTRMVIWLCAPIFKTIWDVIDVAADGYYFQQLETGDLVDANITRNTHVNNLVMAFAALGALKSIILGAGYMSIMSQHGNNNDNIDQNSEVLWFAQLIVAMKILLEDAPEMFLEYFYVDRYVTANQPWGLIIKDVVTGIIYIAPLLNMKNLKKEYKITQDAGYIPMVLFQVLFSLTMVARVVGMILQYQSGTVAAECLQVTDIGTLIQTPFSAGCLNAVDWTILGLLGGLSIIGLFIIPVLCFALILIIRVYFDDDDE